MSLGNRKRGEKRHLVQKKKKKKLRLLEASGKRVSLKGERNTESLNPKVKAVLHYQFLHNRYVPVKLCICIIFSIHQIIRERNLMLRLLKQSSTYSMFL